MFTIATIKDLDSGIVSSLELRGTAFTFRSTPPASWANIEESVKTVSQEEARETLLVWRERTSEGGRVLVLHEDQLLLETHFGARHLEMLVGEAESEEDYWDRMAAEQDGPPDEGPEAFAMENASPAAPFDPEAQEDLELHNSLHPTGYRGECEHDWQIDTPCDLVDTCSRCGEQRA